METVRHNVRGAGKLLGRRLQPILVSADSTRLSTRDDTQRFIGNAQCTSDGDGGRMAEVTLPLCCKYCMVWINHKVRTVRTVYETIPKKVSPCSETVSPDSKGWSHPERQPVKSCSAHRTSDESCMTEIRMSLPACRCGSFRS